MDLECDKSILSNSSCRFCLGNFDLTNSLFDYVEYESESYKVEMREMLSKLTKVVVINTDETIKPVRLCQDCTEKLINAYEFICNVEKNEEIISDYFNKVEQEEEEEEELSQDYETVDEQPVEMFNYDEPQDMEYLEEDYNIMENFAPIDEPFTDENPLMGIDNAGENAEMWTTHLPSLQEAEEAKQHKVNAAEQKEHKVTMRKPRINANATAAKQRAAKQYSIGSRLGIYETSNWHKCNDCDRSFAKLSTLERHVKVAHTPVSAEDFAAIAPKPTSEQPIQCDHCLRTFVRKDALQRHVQAMHPEHADTVAKTPNESATKNKCYKRRMCPYCGEYFSQAGLIVHIRRHTGETPYQCEECGKGFPRRQDMVLHMRQHSGEKPHLCTVCGKSFKNPNKLSRHTRIHTGIRPYKCTKCDKGFAQSNDLKIHMRRHTGEKPYKCDVCGEGFICGAALKTHRKNKLHHEPLLQEMVDPYEKVRVRNRVKLNAIGEFPAEETEEIITDDYVDDIKTEGEGLVDVISLIVTKE